jgi:hypothetical protein
MVRQLVLNLNAFFHTAAIIRLTVSDCVDADLSLVGVVLPRRAAASHPHCPAEAERLLQDRAAERATPRRGQHGQRGGGGVHAAEQPAVRAERHVLQLREHGDHCECCVPIGCSGNVLHAEKSSLLADCQLCY